MKRMRTAAESDSATPESDVENSCNTDNEVETDSDDSASESDSDNADDTSSEVDDEYEWAPLKVEAAQQSLAEFEELIANFTSKGFDENEAKDKAYLLILSKLRTYLQNIYLERLL
jgi:hypothetical protein